MERIPLDSYFLKIAMVVSERSTCRRRKVGAIAVKDKHILATGYNGAAAGQKDCLELGCLRDENGIASGTCHEICRAIHAEQNIVVQSSLNGVSLKNSTIYCTHTPCIICAKILVNSGIKRFVSFSKYSEKNFIDLFSEAGIQVDLLEKPESKIFFSE